MFKKIIACIIGVVFMTTPFVYAEIDINYWSPLDVTEDNYIRFGDSEHPQDDDYLMSIYPDKDSVSAQWIDITFQINEPGLAQFKDIDKFLVLANGKIVDYIYPQYEVIDGLPQIAETYIVKPSIPELIGTDVYFQVVAISEVQNEQSAVAWTGYSNVITMDDLPVKDEEAIAVLEAILDKLQELKKKLQDIEGLLSKISAQIETQFTPSPEALERFENAQQAVWEKTPMKQTSDQTKQISEMFENTSMDAPMSKMTLGDERDWLMLGFDFYLLDFSELQEEIKLMRDFLDAVIWVQFFIFILFYLAPKLDI